MKAVLYRVVGEVALDTVPDPKILWCCAVISVDSSF